MEESRTWGARCTAAWLLLVPCPIATSSLSRCPEIFNYVEKSTVLWCLPSPSAQPCSVWQLLHPYTDVSTDLQCSKEHVKPFLGAAGPNLRHWGHTWEPFPVSFPLPTSSQCNTTHKLTSYQQDGDDPAPFAAPFSLPRLWAQLLLCCASLRLAPSLAFAKRWGSRTAY